MKSGTTRGRMHAMSPLISLLSWVSFDNIFIFHSDLISANFYILANKCLKTGMAFGSSISSQIKFLHQKGSFRLFYGI